MNDTSGTSVFMALCAAVCLALSGPRAVGAVESWEFAPYHIQVWLAVEPSPQLPPAIYDELVRTMIDRSDVVFGGTWDLKISPVPAAFATEATYRLRELAVESIVARAKLGKEAAVKKDKTGDLTKPAHAKKVETLRAEGADGAAKHDGHSKPDGATPEGAKPEAAKPDDPKPASSGAAGVAASGAASDSGTAAPGAGASGATGGDVSGGAASGTSETPAEPPIDPLVLELRRLFTGDKTSLKSGPGGGASSGGVSGGPTAGGAPSGGGPTAANSPATDKNSAPPKGKPLTTQDVLDMIVETPPADKLFVVSVQVRPEHWVVQARELDIRTRQWGVLAESIVTDGSLVAAEAVSLMHSTFLPIAKIEFVKDKTSATLRLRAGGLAPNENCPALLQKNAALRAWVRFNDRYGEPKPNGVSTVPWTALVVRERIGSGLDVEIHSGNRAPLSSKSNARNERFAMAARPAHPATTLQFRTTDKVAQPLSGYDVYAKDPRSEDLVQLGRTDWRGQMDVTPDDDFPVRLVYVKNGGSLLARLPLIPGVDRKVNVDLQSDDRRLQAEGYLNGFQASLTDAKAQQELLIKRIQARLVDGKYDEVEKSLAEFRTIATRDDLQKLIDQAQPRITSPHTKVQKKIDKLFAENRDLLYKHINPNTLRALEQQLEQAKASGRRPGTPLDPAAPPPGSVAAPPVAPPAGGPPAGGAPGGAAPGAAAPGGSGPPMGVPPMGAAPGGGPPAGSPPGPGGAIPTLPGAGGPPGPPQGSPPGSPMPQPGGQVPGRPSGPSAVTPGVP